MLKSLSRWTSLVIPGTAMLGAGIRRIGVLQRIEEATVSMLDRESKQPVSYRDNWRPREVPDTRGEQIARIPDRDLVRAIESAREALLALQHAEGYWCFELEADCTISAEYILMMHFMGEIDEALQAKIAVYLRDRQDTHDGWSLYPGGDFDLSGSVKVYYALKLTGDSPDLPHMHRAREAILGHGGAAYSNVFTRITLALFGQIPWRGVPFIPVEIMLLPRWFPFHISRVSYWSRTVMVPLTILYSLKARAKNPTGVSIDELFTVPPEQERNYFPVRSRLNRVLLAVERSARRLEPLIPGWVRRRAIKKAEAWIIERLNGKDGLGAIFPAMVNAAGLPAGASLSPDDDDGAAKAPGDRRALGLLSTLCLAGVGYGAGVPGVARSQWRQGNARHAARAGLAQIQAAARSTRGLERVPANAPAGRVAVSVWQRLLSRS
jgi:hypothetical protein